MKLPLPQSVSRIAASSLLIAHLFIYPTAAFAQEGAPVTTGPQTPNGADYSTYIYNETTGLWENDHFTWNPTTKQTTPKTAPNYSYNPTTGQWDTTNWQYNATKGIYDESTVSSPAPPTETHAPTPSLAEHPNTNPTNTNHTAAEATIVKNTTQKHAYDTYYDATISNDVSSNSISGNAAIAGNTAAGNATTGDAVAINNILNVLQSSWTPIGLPGGLATFTTDVFGNFFGDMIFDPSLLAPGSNTLLEDTSKTALELNLKSNGKIDNTVNLNAHSGDAEINDNSSAGSANSGSAHAVANIGNIINSAITAGQSFLGVINIHDNLNGDILLPDGYLDSLIAGSAPSSKTQITDADKVAITAHTDVASAIDNQVTTNATTGNATLTQNSVSGDAVTGDALTNQTTLDLIGRDIIGGNSLLVFINTLGGWMGTILDAPNGTKAAALGGDLEQTSQRELSATLDAQSNNQISNNINVNAESGDATVTKNSLAGDAVTGDATASVNLLNIVDSDIRISDWFGVLFINVFGDWVGSFGVDTVAGNTRTPVKLEEDIAGATSNQENTPKAQAISSVGTDAKKTTTGFGGVGSNNSGAPRYREYIETVAIPVKSSTVHNDNASNTTLPQHTQSRWTIPAIGTSIGALLLGAERILSKRQTTSATKLIKTVAASSK